MEHEETAAERVIRLGLKDVDDDRLKLLSRAHSLVDDAVFSRLSDAIRLSVRSTIVLPRNHLENLSRGKGWCRKGCGDSAEWGEREDRGYRVGPGAWTVGGSDGYTRKRSDTWTVSHAQVGAETWTIAV